MPNMWMTESEKAFFLYFIKEEDSYLEWGSGGSTLAVAPIVKNLTSIEHDKEWYEKISKQLPTHRKSGLGYDYRLVPPDRPRSFPYVKREEFETYINEVHKINRTYDKVLIDGRARIWCAYEVIPHLNPNAIVLVHDWDRVPYHVILDKYKLYRCCGRMAALKLK